MTFEYRDATLWTAPLAASEASLVRRKVAKLDDSLFRGGGRSPANKASWIHDMGSVVQTLYPQIRGIEYFDHAQTMYTDPTIFPWQLEQSPQSMAAWKTMATQPFFRHNG